MYKIGIIGDKDSILEFKAAGMSVFPVTTPFQAQELLEKIADEQFAVIYITEHIAKDIVQTIKKYNEKRYPAIIPIPGNQIPLGIVMNGVKKA